MEKKIEKVLRFIELSKKFSKGELDVVPKEKEENAGMYSGSCCLSGIATGYGSITMNLSVEGRELYVDKDGTVKAKDNKVVSRADTLRVIAEAKAKLLEEYWEYQTLQTELTEYFQALKKINE